MINRTEDLLFKGELQVQLHENNTVNDELVELYKTLYIPSSSDKKDFFEFFYQVYDYMAKVYEFDEAIHENVLAVYNKNIPLTDDEKRFIRLSFRLNKYNFGFFDSKKYQFYSLIDELLELCEKIEVVDADTLLNLNRLKLRLAINVTPVTDETIAVVKKYKAEVEEIMKNGNLGNGKEHSIIL